MTAVAALTAVLFAVAPGTLSSSDFTPISHYHDLVAGAGAPGFEDGSFYRARFSSPAGMVFDARRSALFVADSANRRIRAIWLNEGNRVSTLAGSGIQGKQDGPALQAAFDRPAAMTAVSDRLLIVNDEGNALFRAIDLETKSVSTLAGNGTRGTEEGPAGSVGLGGVWNLLFVPAEHAIYFSQPDLEALRKIDLRSKQITTVLQADPRLLNPTALALFQGKICVSDRAGRVFTLPVPAGKQPAALEERWKGSQILAMVADGDRLYALQAQPDRTWNCLSDGKDVVLPLVWGSDVSAPYLELTPGEAAVIVADTTRASSFFVTSTSLNSVLCWKDYGFEGLADSFSVARSGLMDFEYPAKKPDRTFRILLLGDSRVFAFDRGPKQYRRIPEKIETIPKRLELMLNTLAALEGGDTRFEVLSLTRVSWEPLLVWPNYAAPEIARRFDVDFVLMMLPPVTTTLDAYLTRPITTQGIPADQIDPEYLLKPFAEKMRGNPVAAVVRRCQALGWAHPSGDGQMVIDALSTLVTDRAVREGLQSVFGRSLHQLRDGLAKGWRGRAAPPFAICYFPLGSRGSAIPERDFWRELSAREGIPWLDLVDPLVVLGETWYPLNESGGYGHFTNNGHEVVALTLAHELIHSGRIRLRHSRPAPAAARMVSSGVVIALLSGGLAARWIWRRRLRVPDRRARI